VAVERFPFPRGEWGKKRLPRLQKEHSRRIRVKIQNKRNGGIHTVLPTAGLFIDHGEASSLHPVAAVRLDTIAKIAFPLLSRSRALPPSALMLSINFHCGFDAVPFSPTTVV
jgi:hypothetical protein